MPRLFVGNFDFEYRLAHPHVRQLPDRFQRLNLELASSWLSFADNDDAIWLPAILESGFLEQLASQGLPSVRQVHDKAVLKRISPTVLCPWAWSPDVNAWAEHTGSPNLGPEWSSVARANSRRFSTAIEEEWSIGLEGAALIHSFDELRSAILRLPTHWDGWVVKSEFSNSARERVLGRGRSLPDNLVTWAQKRFASGFVVSLEPWVERIEEAGLQFTIPRPHSTREADRPRLEGVTTLLTSTSGGYCGSCVANDFAIEQQWEPAVACGLRVAERLQAAGYFGPFGIDAVRYRDPLNGEIRLRPVQDINARFTMGRLSLGFRRFLNAGESGIWLHVNWGKPNGNRGKPNGNRGKSSGSLSPAEWFAERCKNLPQNVSVVRTSPFVIDGRHTTHGSLFLSGPSRVAVADACTQMQDNR